MRNGSSTSAEVTELIVEDSTPEVFERFDVTSVGSVTFPAGADQVTVSACTVVESVCDDAADRTGTPQSGPALSLPAGVDAADVTGLRFIFSSSAGSVLPVDPTGGSVQIGTLLRDTLRSSGDDYSPTVREDIDNCATPAAIDEVQGEVSATQACSTYSVQPAQATIAMNSLLLRHRRQLLRRRPGRHRSELVGLRVDHLDQHLAVPGRHDDHHRAERDLGQ